MVLCTLKKTMLHLMMSVLLCLAVWTFSGGGAVYAGFMAGLLGAAYLLAAWLMYLKSRGKDPFAFLKRNKTPSVPYFHRKEKGVSSKLRFFHERHELEDDGLGTDGSDPKEKSQCGALAFLICGVVMLVMSLLPV